MTRERAYAQVLSERLARSREGLRRSLQASAPEQTAGASGLERFGQSTLLTGVDALLIALRAWWAHQPLRRAGVTLAETANLALQPLAQRAPFGLLASAAALGGLLGCLRPWRLLPTSALLATVLPSLLGNAVTHPSLQSKLIDLLLRSGKRTRGEAGDARDARDAHNPR